jgi:hypothetical protein
VGLVDERVYAAIRSCSVKGVLQRERQLNVGCPFRRINERPSNTSPEISGRFSNRSQLGGGAL